MMRIAYSLFAILFIWSASRACAPGADRPNILIILADDLGWSDLGCYGGEIRTPNLDLLARDGIRFTQCYNGARCCPSRASLLTGLYPHQAGVGAMTTNRPGQGEGYRGALNDRCVTIAEVCASSGYHTAASGKWHVSNQDPPTARGFEDFYGFSTGYAIDSWDEGMMIRLPQGRPQHRYSPGGYFATDAITDNALDFITGMQTAGAPWLLYLAYQAPHFPLQSKPEDMAGYAALYAQGWDRIREQRLERQQRLGLLPAGVQLSPRSVIPSPGIAKRHGSMTDDACNPPWEALPADRRADLIQRMAVYAGMVTGMDRGIGRAIAALRATHQLENTLILFLSDNGACAEWDPYGFDLPVRAAAGPGNGIDGGTERMGSICHVGDDLLRLGGPGSRISYGSGWANVSNAPFRMYKHFVHEGGISTPLIIHWPAGMPAADAGGRVVSQPTHLIDVMATVVDVAKAVYPESFNGHRIEPLEGLSLRPFMAALPPPPAWAQRDLCWEHEGNAAIRNGDRKLVRSGGGGRWELYDMATDRTELHDLAAARPAEVRALVQRWEAWAERVHVHAHARRPGQGPGPAGDPQPTPEHPAD